MSDSPLLTRAEAARWCRVSLAAFDAHVRPHLSVKRIGRRVVFHRADLEAWAQSEAATPKLEPFKGAPSLRHPAPGSCGGPLLAQLLADPRAQETLKFLQRKGGHRGSTS